MSEEETGARLLAADNAMLLPLVTRRCLHAHAKHFGKNGAGPTPLPMRTVVVVADHVYTAEKV